MNNLEKISKKLREEKTKYEEALREVNIDISPIQILNLIKKDNNWLEETSNKHKLEISQVKEFRYSFNDMEFCLYEQALLIYYDGMLLKNMGGNGVRKAYFNLLKKTSEKMEELRKDLPF